MKNNFKIQSSISVGFIFVLLGLILSCEDNFDESAFVTDVSVNMTSFVVANQSAMINNEESTVTLDLPYGTEVSSLSPQIELPVNASVIPEQGSTIDFSNVVKYKVVNENIYKLYDVKITTQKPILSFKINELEANINDNSKMITLIMPEGTDLTSLTPEIETSEGVTISPASGDNIDFTNTVIYKVSSTNLTEDYKAVITTPQEGPRVAFLGTSPSRSEISNPDEIAASNWLFENYPQAEYLSFSDVSNGASLDGIDVIWWHFDEAQNLPTVALASEAISAIKGYQENGGHLLLTTFASQYLEPLGIVPTGKNPNNIFGDFPPNGFVDGGDWGMSFVGHEDHPIFIGLETYASGKANLLEAGTFRLNHTAWWFLPEWGGYENGEGWRNQTGGINLASEAWDDNLDGRVTIAEFPNAVANSNTVVISMGAYDWYNETDANGNPSQTNAFLDNIKILTENGINYLANN